MSASAWRSIFYYQFFCSFYNKSSIESCWSCFCVTEIKSGEHIDGDYKETEYKRVKVIVCVSICLSISVCICVPVCLYVGTWIVFSVCIWGVLSVSVDKCVFLFGVQLCAACMTISEGQRASFLSYLVNKARQCVSVCVGYVYSSCTCALSLNIKQASHKVT